MKRIISFVLCAAMLMSSFVFVAEAADAQVQAVINAIDAIGEVHRNETLIPDLSFDGMTLNAIATSEYWESRPDSWNNMASYCCVTFSEGSNTDGLRRAPVLLWNRDFQVTLQFVPAENNAVKSSSASYFGCRINNVFAGYHFGKKAFVISDSDGNSVSNVGTARHEKAIDLDPDTAYTMRIEFIAAKDVNGNITIDDNKLMEKKADGTYGLIDGATPGYTAIYLNDELVVTSQTTEGKNPGYLPKNAKGATNKYYMGFKPWVIKDHADDPDLDNNAWNWRNLYVFGVGSICNVIRFEASTFDVTDDTPWGDPADLMKPWTGEGNPSDDETMNAYFQKNSEVAKRPLRVNDLSKNFKTNWGWYNSSFTCKAYLDSGEKIAAAKSAYMALTPPQKKEVSNYKTLVEKMRQYYNLTPAYGGIDAISSEALAVVDAIDAIGEVTNTDSCKAAIEAAENAYAALTDEQKAEVYNYDVLVCSRQEYDAFHDPDVTALMDAIAALNPVTLASKEAIEACEAKYASFNSALKTSVTNYADLVKARTEYDTLCVEEVRGLIAAIGDVTKDSADAVNLAKSKYEALRDDLKARVADVKPVLDAAKTDLRMINLDGLDYTDPEVISEVRLAKNYYQIQSAAAKALMKNKGYLDAALDVVIDVVEAQQIDSRIDSIGDVAFMEGTTVVNGLGFNAKSGQGYSNLSVYNPIGDKVDTKMHAPYTVSFDIVIKRWLNDVNDNSARIAVYTKNDIALAYNGVEKKFVIGDPGKGGFSGMDNPTGDYAESEVIELKLNVPYNIAFELDRDHVAIYLNGRQVAYTDKVAYDPESYLIFYPAGLDMIVTGYEMIFNGEVVANHITGDQFLAANNKDGDMNTCYTWKGFQGVWNPAALATNDKAINDSGYIVETLYNRYMALSENEKALVTKSDKLIKAYKEYADKKNYGLIQVAIDAINEIGDVSLDSLNVIASAEYAYSEVPENFKSEVTNLATLTAARAKYDELYGKDINDRIANIGEVTFAKSEEVKRLNAAYNAMTDAQKQYVTDDSVAALNDALDVLAEFAKAVPVDDAIDSITGVDFNNSTLIDGVVKEYKITEDGYTLLQGADSILGTKGYQIEYDFQYSAVESSTKGVIQGSNNGTGSAGVLNGVDLAHNMVFIKTGANPFAVVDPALYDKTAAYTFYKDRWYHYKVVYAPVDNTNYKVSIYIDDKLVLEHSEVNKDYAENSGNNIWYIVKGISVNGLLTNAVATTNVDKLPDGVTERSVVCKIGSTYRYPAGYTIGQYNKANVTRAREMYNALSPLARTAVTKIATLEIQERSLGITPPTEAALKVIDMINLLDSNSDQDALDAAEAAYRALTSADKRGVTNYSYLRSLFDEKAAAVVIEMINNLTVNSSDDDIAVAEVAYNDLTAAQKKLVENYGKIADIRSAKAAKAVVDAIAKLNVDSAEADIIAVQNMYNALSDAQKGQVTNYADLEALIAKISEKKVNAVIEAIDKLNDSSDRETVNAVKAQYDALTDAEKEKVTNIGKLNDIINNSSAAVAGVVVEKINKLSAGSSEEEVMAVKAEYDALTADEKKFVTNYDALKTLVDNIMSAKAQVVVDAIAKLNVTSNDADIKAAEDAYAALAEDAKPFVSNYNRIKDVRDAKAVISMIEALDNGSSDADVTAALNAYNGLSATAKALVNNKAHLDEVRSEKAVAAVIAMIDKLSKDSSDEEIDAAEAAYEALADIDPELQDRVHNYKHIEDVREQKKDPAVTAVVAMIQKLNVNSSAEELAAAVDAYEKLEPEQKAQVYNYPLIVTICDEKAKALVAQIDGLPELRYVDIYHNEDAIKAAERAYDALVKEAQEKVTNYSKLQALSEKLSALTDWNKNKDVNILNSTFAGFAKYDQETIDSYLKEPVTGIYYIFEEVDKLDRGESTTGYFAFDDVRNEMVKNESYVKLDFDINVTDVDLINGWPMLFKLMIGDTHTGYDFVNKGFFCGTVTNMDHGALQDAEIFVPYEFELGVWHHLTFELDRENISISLDGKEVLKGTFVGQYSFCIFYPWLCNLELTNAVYTNRNGDKLLSALKKVNTNPPTGWKQKSNAKGAVMLDLVKTSVQKARAAYEALTAEQKEQIVGLENLENVEAMIARAGKRDIVVSGGLASGTLVDEGATVTIVADAAPAGKVFDKWEVVSGDVELADASAMTTTFVVGAENVEIKATYKDIGCAITVTGGTADVASAAAGATVTITADAPAEGMVFDKWEVVSGGVELANANDASTTFTMGEEAVEVKAIYKPDVKVTPGDVNGDTRVNAKDIIAVMKFMLGNAPEGFIEAAGDLNGDNRINAKDIILIMKIMLGGK